MKALNIFTFCEQLMLGKLDEQILDLEKEANHQLEYNHPLKPKTTAEQHMLGKHNMGAVELLRQLKIHLIKGQDPIAN